MKKLLLVSVAAVMLMLSTSSKAGLMTELPEETYITENGLDWTWVSRWGTGSALAPELPTFHAGWRYATTAELDYLFENLVALFLNAGNPIESTAYWNEPNQVGVDQTDLSGGYIMSGTNMMSYGNGLNCTGSTPCDTFYVRTSVEVPAPASVALWLLALVALRSVRKKS